LYLNSLPTEKGETVLTRMVEKGKGSKKKKEKTIPLQLFGPRHLSTLNS
jgi:hypothetical protein